MGGWLDRRRFNHKRERKGRLSGDEYVVKKIEGNYHQFTYEIHEQEIEKRGNTPIGTKIKLHMFQLWSSVFAKSVLVMIKLRSAMFRVSNMQPQLLLFSITNVSISLSNLHLDHQGGHIPPCDASFCPPIFLSLFPY